MKLPRALIETDRAIALGDHILDESSELAEALGLFGLRTRSFQLLLQLIDRCAQSRERRRRSRSSVRVSICGLSSRKSRRNHDPRHPDFFITVARCFVAPSCRKSRVLDDSTLAQ